MKKQIKKNAKKYIKKHTQKHTKKLKPQQLPLFSKDLFKNQKRFFGGALLKGRRKSKRPLSTREPIHIVMRSILAKGPWSFMKKRNRLLIERILKKHSKRWGLRLYRQAIVSNHIHLCVQLSNRFTWPQFIRSVTGEIAYFISKQEWGFRAKKWGYGQEDLKKTKNFWEYRPFTRVLHWGRDFKRVCAYVEQNVLEAIGFLPFTPRTDWYANLFSSYGSRKKRILSLLQGVNSHCET